MSALGLKSGRLVTVAVAGTGVLVGVGAGAALWHATDTATSIITKKPIQRKEAFFMVFLLENLTLASPWLIIWYFTDEQFPSVQSHVIALTISRFLERS